MTRPFELTATFRRPNPPSVTEQVDELYRLLPAMLDCSTALAPWYLKGKSKEEALRYIALDANGPVTAGMAVLTENLKHDVDPRIVSVWNGREGSEAASLQYTFRPAPERSAVVLRAKPEAFSKRWEAVAELIKSAVSIWRPSSLSVDRFGGFEHKVFKDRPAVGWMLYLPAAISTQQVPEARALLPVTVKDEKGKDEQVGTIIVSTVDDPYSDENPEHVKVANAIEVRLVDQDLLPRYKDL